MSQAQTSFVDVQYSIRRIAPGIWFWRATPRLGVSAIGGVALGKDAAKRAAEREIAKRRATLSS